MMYPFFVPLNSLLTKPLRVVHKDEFFCAWKANILCAVNSCVECSVVKRSVLFVFIGQISLDSVKSK